MASPTELDVDTLLGDMNMDALMALADNGSMFENLQEFLDDVEGRIVVSSMVQEAVAKGFLKAIEEESRTELACKDEELSRLKNKLKERDASIFDLQRVLGLTENEESVGLEKSKSKQLWDFLQESQNKWRETELSIAEKEKELENLASNMARMASILDNESRRAALLEKQWNDLKEQETIKSGQISSLQQEIVKIKLDNSRLKRQGRLKTLQFDESMEQTRGELQQQRLELENLAQERKALGKALEDKNRAFSDLEADRQSLAAEAHSLDERVKTLLMVKSTLEEGIEGQKLLQQCEQEFLMTYMEQQLAGLRLTMMADDTTELAWKDGVESVITQVVMDGWYKEVTDVLHKLTYELAWKDEEIFYRDGELGSLKQAVEELENDYATLMSICLTLIRDQNDNDTREEPSGLLVHELGRRKLMELTEFLSSREASGGQEEKSALDLEEFAAQQLQHELELEIVSEVFKQELPIEGSGLKEVSVGQGSEPSLRREFEEDLASQQLRHEVEFDIVSEVVSQKFQEACDASFKAYRDCGLVEASEKKMCNNFEELEAQLESFLELEACRLEMIRTGCSTSIAKCEFKLDKLMKNLADQVNEMKAKITFVQDAIKQQEWKHMLEEEILILVLRDTLEEMHKSLKLDESREQAQDGLMRPCILSSNSRSLSEIIDASFSPKLIDLYLKSEIESHRSECSHQMPGILDKDRLILFLKSHIEELRKEKAVIEQKLDDRTEELYSLKRQFWKEKEIWVSKLSQPQRKEVEAQVDALSRHSSAALDLEEELKKLEGVRFDAVVSGLRKEWLAEKEGLLQCIALKEIEIEGLAGELQRFKEKEKNSNATEAGLLARIAELKIQADNFSTDRLNQDFLFAKCKQEWQSEKESLREEINSLLDKERAHAASECGLSARIVELDTEVDRLSSRTAELETEGDHLSKRIAELETHTEISRLASLDHEASLLKLKQVWQSERDFVTKLASEKEDLTSKLLVLSEQEKHSTKLIKELESERDRLTMECSNKSTYLAEEKEIALALAIKEKEEEEKRRKMLESQLQGLRLEIKNLQGLNGKVAYLEGKLEAIPRQLELKLAEQIKESLRALQEFEKKVTHMMQEKSVSLDEIKEKCRSLKGQLIFFGTKEGQHKQRLAKELSNLQKAEAEVDLLGDEVEALLDILEEVQVAFDLYAPVLQHYPRMTEVAKLVKQEIQLRIDPKYGT